MAYGFRCINDAGEIIISDELQTMHFVGKATKDSDDGGNYTTLTTVDDGSGGTTIQTTITTSTDFPLFTGAIASNAQDGNGNALDGRVLIDYSITTSGIPLVFIKPNNSAYDRWYALVNQSEGANDVWTFQILMSGATADLFPELFCFVDANRVPIGSEGYGMVVYKDDITIEAVCDEAEGFWGGKSGDPRDDNTCYASATTSDTTVLKVKTFDSRALPLAVVGAENTNVRPFPPNEGVPLVAENVGLYTFFRDDELDHDFHSNDFQALLGECFIGSGTLLGVTENYCDFTVTNPNAFTLGNNRATTIDTEILTSLASQTEVPFTNFMFAASSMGQAVYTRQLHGFATEFEGNSGEFYSLAAWWVMYRAAFRIQNNGRNYIEFQAGWGTYDAGYNNIEERTIFEFFGNDVQSREYGSQPYSAKTINIEQQQNPFIIADATKYI